MTFLKVETSQAPDAPHLLSQALVANGFVFVSGQIHAKPGNELIEGSTKEKLDQIFANLSAILDAAGSSLSEIVKVTLYVTEIDLLAEINEVYASYLSDPLPAREGICVKELPLGASIEISVIASAK